MFTLLAKLTTGKVFGFFKGLFSNPLVQYALIAVLAAGLLWKGFTWAADTYTDKQLTKSKEQVSQLVQVNKENAQTTQDIKDSADNAQKAVEQVLDIKADMDTQTKVQAEKSEVKIKTIQHRYAKASDKAAQIKDPVKRVQKQQALDQDLDTKISEVWIGDLWGNYCTALGASGQQDKGCK